MSTAQHGAAAREHQQIAEEHQRQYNATRAESYTRCGPGGSRGLETGGGVCWTSSQNPTEVHQAEADRHRLEAAEHRAASGALREAEARDCTGVAPADRDRSPFTHVEDVLDVRAITGSGANVAGAIVTFRPVPGLSQERLQAIVDCHLARNAALGHIVPEEPNCPLVPRGVTAEVHRTARGFEVEIRATDASTARDVLARAKRLVEGHTVTP